MVGTLGKEEKQRRVETTDKSEVERRVDEKWVLVKS